MLVPTGVGAALAAQTLAQRFVHEAWRHGKPIAVASDAEALREAAGVPTLGDGVAGAAAAALAAQGLADLGRHRFPRRVSALRPSWKTDDSTACAGFLRTSKGVPAVSAPD